MKLASPHRRARSIFDLPMTSMIDVVFLLLIFFVVTSQFRPTERQLGSQIRFRTAGPSDEVSDLEPIVVQVLSGDDGPEYLVGSVRCDAPEALRGVLRRLASRPAAAFVRVGDDVAFDAAARAVEACRAAGFAPVSYVPWHGGEEAEP